MKPAQPPGLGRSGALWHAATQLSAEGALPAPSSNGHAHGQVESAEVKVEVELREEKALE